MEFSLLEVPLVGHLVMWCYSLQLAHCRTALSACEAKAEDMKREMEELLVQKGARKEFTGCYYCDAYFSSACRSVGGEALNWACSLRAFQPGCYRNLGEGEGAA